MGGRAVKLPTKLEIAKGTAKFVKYRSGELWYDLYWNADDDEQLHPRVLPFPISIVDTGDGDFTPEMKGLNVLRWARKYVEQLAIELENE